MARTLPVTLIYRLLEVVDVDHGHWCPRCLLPSAVRITLASIIECNGVTGPLTMSTRLRCSDGHGWLPDAGH